MSVFLGWMPGEDAKPTFAALRQQVAPALPADAPRHDWRTPGQWHMTLFHLGEAITDDARERLSAHVAAHAATTTCLETRIDGVQYWPDANVLVAKLAGTPALMTLFEYLEVAASSLGFPREKRKPNPHVTLAYLPRGSAMPRIPVEIENGATVAIERIDLLQTVRDGYRSLAGWPLRTAGIGA